ncbi:MAG TPA: peptidase, partial [Nitrosarchaeum sp.]|nr:peptidase [Nitrosarchaeum sp.]
AYFANVDKAKIADQISFNGGIPGEGLDFGTFCSKDTTIFGPSFSNTVGFSFPGDSGITGTDGTTPFQQCTGTPTSSFFDTNVVRQPPGINTNSNVPTGQIGLTASAWPIIQLFSFNNDVEIQYNPGGGIQKIDLEYDEMENISLKLDRQNYPNNAEVFITLSDFQLNQDPTTRDSWTFKVTSPLATFYQAYDENGIDSANGNAGLVNLDSKLSSLNFDKNGKISMTLGNVIQLQTNDHQPDLFVSDGINTFSDIITLVESQPNSGIFESFDNGDKSVVKIKSDAPRGQSSTISYNSKSDSIISGSSTASVSVGSQSDSFKAGTKQSVTIVDADQNKNPGARDHLDIFRSSAIIPTLQIGIPLTLEKSSNVKFYPLSTSDLVLDGIDIPSSMPDTNSDRLILDTRPPISISSFEKISINLGLSAEQLESLLIDVDDPSSDGTNWLNYDLRSLQQQLSVNNFGSTSMSLYFGLSDSSPVTIVDAGDISNPQGLVQIDDDDIDAISLKSGTAFLVINFGSSNGGIISSETDTQPIVVDFFSFGIQNDQITNNAIYRFELEETSTNSGTFVGTMEYTVTNQLNFFSPTLIKSLRTINDEIRFLVNERLIDEKGIAIKYSDLATVGTKIDVSTKSDIQTNSGTIGFSTQSFRLGHPVGIVLKDPDLNLDKNTIESYSVVNDPNSPNVDTVGDSSGNPILEIMIKGVRYKRCTINGVENGGLASTGFTLTETSPSSGIFEGVFRLPTRICNESGTALISPAGGSIELKYFDFRDAFGNPNTFTTGRVSSSSTQSSSLSINAEKFVLPKYKETIDVIVTGKIDNYKQGTVIKLVLETPDRSSQSFNLFA